MPRKKNTVNAHIAEVKAEVVNETVKETVAEVARKSAKKPAAKKTLAKNSVLKKLAAKASDKTSKIVTAPKEIIKVQFDGEEYDLSEIQKAVEADYNGKVKDKITSVELYIKPEDKAVYYVVNSDFSGKIEL